MPDFLIGGYPVNVYHGDADGSEAIVEDCSDPAQGPVATVRLQCPWAGRYVVWKAFLGYALGGYGGVIRIPPIAYPDSPDLYCMGIGEVKGVKYKGGFKYELCQFRATFKRPTYDVEGAPEDPSGQPYTTTRVRVSAEVTTVPLGAYLWTAGVDAGQPVAESQLGLLAPRLEFSITRHVMPYAPVDEVMTFVGTINQNPVRIGNRTFERGRLLFCGADMTETVDIAAGRTYEVGYTALGVKHDWNELLDRELVYRLVNTEADASGESPFEYAEFWEGLP